jgi:hypothetical protein
MLHEAPFAVVTSIMEHVSLLCHGHNIIQCVRVNLIRLASIKESCLGQISGWLHAGCMHALPREWRPADTADNGY